MFACAPVKRSTEKASRGQQLREAFQELGPVFIKFGQMLSSRPDLLPFDIAQELALLQDKVPPFESKKAHEILKATYGDSLDTIFSHIEMDPVASASVAQVHFAELRNVADADKEVVIKILRPNIKPIIDQDIGLLYFLANMVQKLWAQGPRLKPVEVVYEYEKTIHHELDLVREAANASQLRANFEDSDVIYVPKVYFDYTHTNVMVMERIEGIPIRDVAALKEHGLDMKKLGHDGVEIFFTQVFRDGFFHADMHPGNIFVGYDGQYKAIDFGIVGTLSDEDKHYLAVNFLCFFNRDYRGVAVAHIQSGWVPSNTRVEEFESAIRTVCEPIFAKPMSEISFGKFIMRLFQVAREFQMPIQPQLVLLQKTLLNVEGLGRQLYPELDLWESAKPILERWMNEQSGPKGFIKSLKNEAPMWAKQFPQVPNLIHQSLIKLNEQDNKFASLELRLEKSQQKITRLSRLNTVAIMALVAVIIYSIMA